MEIAIARSTADMGGMGFVSSLEAGVMNCLYVCMYIPANCSRGITQWAWCPAARRSREFSDGWTCFVVCMYIVYCAVTV